LERSRKRKIVTTGGEENRLKETNMGKSLDK
jgi:hypothetical protein